MVKSLGSINSKKDLKRFEEYDIIFIDRDGKVFASKDIKDHAKFNNEFAKDNPKLVERYKKSNWNNMTLFLICEEGYIQSLSGECIDCIDLGLLGCNKCEEDPNNKGKYICTKCVNNSIFDLDNNICKCNFLKITI